MTLYVTTLYVKHSTYNFDTLRKTLYVTLYETLYVEIAWHSTKNTLRDTLRKPYFATLYVVFFDVEGQKST